MILCRELLQSLNSHKCTFRAKARLNPLPESDTVRMAEGTWSVPARGQFAKHHLNRPRFNSSPISGCVGGVPPALPKQ